MSTKKRWVKYPTFFCAHNLKSHCFICRDIIKGNKICGMGNLEQKKEMTKSTKETLVISFLVFFIAFLVILILRFIPTFFVEYRNPFIFLVFVVVAAVAAFATLLYVNYKKDNRHSDWRSYALILSLVGYFVFFLVQAFSENVELLQNDVVFAVTPYFGFFFGTLIFFIILNFQDRGLKYLYNNFLFMSMVLVAIFLALSGLLYIPIIGVIFLKGSLFILIATEVIFGMLLYSLIKGVKTQNKGYGTYFIIGVTILASFTPATLLVANWTLFWWFCITIDLFGFSCLIAGFFKKEDDVGKIEDVFPKVVFYSRIGVRFLVFIIIIFAFVVATLVHFSFEYNKQQIEKVIVDREIRSESIAREIESRFDTYVEDISSMSSHVEFRKFIQAKNEALSEDVISMLAKHVSLMFGVYVDGNTQYKKVYYVDNIGRKIIIANETGVEFIQYNFVNVYNEEYFQGVMHNDVGEINISDVVIDPQSDQTIDVEPIIYVSSPVFGANGKFSGVVVIEVDATDFMVVVSSQNTEKNGVNFVLVDQNGNFVVNFDNPEYEHWRDLWGFDTVFSNFKILKEHTLLQDDRTHGACLYNFKNGDKKQIITHRKVSYVPDGGDHYFILIEQTPESVVLAEARKDFPRNMLIIVLSLGGAILLMYVLNVFSVVTRIFQSVEAVRKLGSGDFSVRVDVKGNDEVSEVAMGINFLAEELEKRQKERKGQKEDFVERAKRAEEASASLEKTKVAVMNILEDLDVEKKKVEDKVEERTKEYKEEKSKLSHVTQHMRTGVVFLEPGGQVMVVNESMRDILGFRDKDIQKVIDALHKKFKKIDFKKVITERSSSYSHEVEVDEKIYSVVIRYESEGGFEESGKKMGKDSSGVFIWVEDVTEDRLIERSKSELVATASHQLRTPLTVARGNVEMLLDEDFGKLNTKQKEMLKDTSDSVIRLISMVNDMLDITKIEKGDLELNVEKFDIEESIGQVIEQLKDYAERHDFEIIHNKPNGKIIVVADREHLQQVFQNLIDNAIRYSRQPGKVEITLLKHVEAGTIEIIIKDNGIGIPKTEQANIFGRFFRAANAVRFASGGSGLGLFIVKSFIEQMDGKIWFDSEENKGTSFHVVLQLGEK